MTWYNLAARSLRHLRFAHRVTVGQPLLARASHISHPPMSIMLDGYQLPIGRILRRLPLHDSTWTADGADGEMDTAPAADVSAPVETLLRLLPRLHVTEDADTTGDVEGDDVGALPAASNRLGQTHARHLADDAPPAPTSPLATLPPARTDRARSRSRIVELPGTVTLPVEAAGPEESSAPDIPEETPADVPLNTHNAGAESVADTTEAAEREPEQRPLATETGERTTTPVPNSAEMATVEAQPVPPAAPTPTSRLRSKKSSTTPPRASDALFPPTDADRSPAAWLARLQHEQEPTSPARPAPPDTAVKPSNESPISTPAQRSGAHGGRKVATREQASTTSTTDVHASNATIPPPEQSSSEERAAPLPGSSRALLQTLTGVDPASVRVYRGPVAERVTSNQNADALTDGDAIALGAGHATDTPETLGLLAHELTHIGQRRSPRFVPPVAISQTRHHQPTAHARATAAIPQAPQSAVAPADEEAQARQVEARVARVARAKTAPPHAIQPALRVESDAATIPARETPSRPGARAIWGNLPAPWEPLPDWMATPTETAVGGPQPAPPPASQPQSASASPARALSANTPGTQRAERGRSLPADTEEPAPAHSQDLAAPEPDLDLLAQQVHAILKRRLAAERRRFG